MAHSKHTCRMTLDVFRATTSNHHATKVFLTDFHEVRTVEIVWLLAVN